MKYWGGGKFYRVVGDDAIILHYLLKYKLKDYKTIIFGKQALDKVKDTLRANRISFIIENTEIKYIFEINNYESIKRNAYEYLDKEERIEIIINKIENMSNKEIDSMLYYLEKFKYEQGFYID